MAKAQKVVKCKVAREPGFLYFIDKKGNVARAKMARPGEKKGKRKQDIVEKCEVKREEGFLYYIDKEGDVARVPMARGRKKAAKKK